MPAAVRILARPGRQNYRQGEIHRLRGHFGAAEAAFREASRLGHEPQPGLALLRLAQGEPGAAASTIRRVVAETHEAGGRAEILPAYIEIMLAVDGIQAARAACREFDSLAAGHATAPSGRRRRRRGAPSSSLRATRRARCVRFATQARSGGELKAPMRRRARESSRPCLPGPRATKKRRRSSWRRPRAAYAELGAASDLARRRLPRRWPTRGGRSWAHRPRARGPAPPRRRPHEPGDRRRAGAQRAHRRPAREQHLRQARRLLTDRGHRLCPTSIGCSERRVGEITHGRQRGSWVFRPMRACG